MLLLFLTALICWDIQQQRWWFGVSMLTIAQIQDPWKHALQNYNGSKWIALITQRVGIGSPNCPGILEVITNCREGKDFGMSWVKLRSKLTFFIVASRRLCFGFMLRRNLIKVMFTRLPRSFSFFLSVLKQEKLGGSTAPITSPGFDLRFSTEIRSCQ